MISDNSDQDPRFRKEEEFMLEAIDRVLVSESGASSEVYNGDIPLFDFFIQYLPPVVTAAMGRIGFPNCEVSRHIGVLILDSRYPLLSCYPDGLVIAPLHAVLATFVVTTVLTAESMTIMRDNIAYAASLSNPWMMEDGLIRNYGFVYRSNLRLSEVESMFSHEKDGQTHPDVCILRLPETDCENISRVGFANGASSGNPLYSMYSGLIQAIFGLLSIRNYEQDGLLDRLTAYKNWPSLGDVSCYHGSAHSGYTVEDNGYTR